MIADDTARADLENDVGSIRPSMLNALNALYGYFEIPRRYG
jgi:hypothetical protein